MSSPNVVTIDVLEKILKAQDERTAQLIQAIKAPPELTPKQKAEEAQAQADREATAQLQLNRLKSQLALQQACTHRRKDRTTTCVYEYMGGYLICQQCQGIIHAGARPQGDLVKETSNHIYDTRMFNEHFQETQAGATTF